MNIQFMNLTKPWLSTLAGTIFAIGLMSPAAIAATIEVDNATSTVADEGECSLPEAIISANTDTTSGTMPGECEAGSGADSITFNLPLAAMNTVTLTGFFIDISDETALPGIVTDITIEGGGVTLTAGGFAGRIMAARAAPLTLRQVTLQGGNSTSQGGGLLAFGEGTEVHIEDSTFRNNNAAINGGGLFVIGIDATDITIVRSSFVGNSTSDSGGGMYIQTIDATGGAFSFVMQNSTVSDNSANDGAEIRLVNGDMSGNTTFSLDHVTITGNTLLDSGGASALSVSTAPSGNLYSVNNSIIANYNSDLNDCDNANLLTGNNNIFSDDDASCTAISGMNNTQVSSAALNLGALQNNGGLTDTFALGDPSAARDNVPSCVLDEDQRGALRLVGSACDTGAYEAGEPAIDVSPLSIDFMDVALGMTSGLETITITNIGNAPLTVLALTNNSVDFTLNGPPATPFTLDHNQTADVNVEFTPPMIGITMGDMDIASNDADKPSVNVTFTGEGVEDVVDPNTLIDEIIALCEQCVIDGDLTGTKPHFKHHHQNHHGHTSEGHIDHLKNKIAKIRLHVWKHKLHKLDKAIGKDKYAKACRIIDKLVKRADGNKRPKDLVKGPCLSETNPNLLGLIDDLDNALECDQ